jgi:hypothetical protein
LLSAAIGIDIEDEIRARAITQLLELESVEMRAERTGDVLKTGLPQRGIVEQPFHENHLGTLLNLLPGI